MSTIAALAAGLFGVIIVFNLTKNIGTGAKPVSAFGQATGATTSIVSSLTSNTIPK